MLKFLIGLALGTCVGVVLAPRSGEETRRELKDKAEELKQRGIRKGREEAREAGSRLGEEAFNRVVGE